MQSRAVCMPASSQNQGSIWKLPKLNATEERIHSETLWVHWASCHLENSFDFPEYKIDLVIMCYIRCQYCWHTHYKTQFYGRPYLSQENVSFSFLVLFGLGESLKQWSGILTKVRYTLGGLLSLSNYTFFFLHCSFGNSPSCLRLCRICIRLRLSRIETAVIKMGSKSSVYFKTGNAQTLHRFPPHPHDSLVIKSFNTKTFHLQRDLKKNTHIQIFSAMVAVRFLLLAQFSSFSFLFLSIPVHVTGFTRKVTAPNVFLS